jgi:hypothetical protein
MKYIFALIPSAGHVIICTGILDSQRSGHAKL